MIELTDFYNDGFGWILPPVRDANWKTSPKAHLRACCEKARLKANIRSFRAGRLQNGLTQLSRL